MKLRPLLVLTLFSALALLTGPLPAAAGDGKDLTHQVTLLVGHPGEAHGQAQADGVLIVPGTVIPVGADVAMVAADAGQRADQLADLAGKLKATLRLADVEVQYDQAVPLKLKSPSRLAAPAKSDLDLRLELLGVSGEVATYRVSFAGAKPLGDSTVAVPIGRRAVVGGLDGSAAPYFFVVLEPRRQVRRADEAGLTRPTIISRVQPQYTAEARAHRIKGLVILDALIGTDGRVSDIQVLQGATHGLTEAAIEAVRRWRFEPARDESGKAVAVRYSLTTSFDVQ